MRVVSWNVNGIRAGVRYGFVDFVDRSAADIVGFQEVRAQPEDIPPDARRPAGWHTAFTVAERRGPVLVIGDYNTAHRAIDLARPQANVTHSGFLPEERAELDRWIDAGWVDAFRTLHLEAPDPYTWWRQWGGARERNIGWRIDYVFASPAAMRAHTRGLSLARRTGFRPLPSRCRYRPVAETSDRNRTSLDDSLSAEA